MDNPISVMLVDDHEVVRQGVRFFLETQPDFSVVAEADSGLTAIKLAEETIPDVVLMDLIMPEMGGVEATRRIKDVSPRTQIVVLTSYHDDEHIFPALQAGAVSYILKDIRMEELAEAIRRAVRGEATLHPRVASRIIGELRGSRTRELNPFTELTNREMEVLRLIANGLSNSKIAAQLVISEYTVKGHVSNCVSFLFFHRYQVVVLA
jgi:NarL family two-component system response regulator LiaR